MTDKDFRSRRFQFTINNYPKKDIKRFHELAESLEKHRYICYGFEKAESTGTPHIQGYVELTQAQRYTFLHSYFNFKRKGEVLKFHIEVANGTAEDNKKYCKKEGDFYEFGEPATQGSRTDLKEIKEAVRADPKATPRIIDEMANNQQQLRYIESLAPYYLKQRSPSIPPKVFWIYGQTGIGKTSLVYRCFSDICSVSEGNWPGTGYRQNECLLFDDFREGTINFEQLLKIADRYPYDLQFKGGFVPLNSPYIVFTSPECIDQSFTWLGRGENLMQLKRRVTEIYIDSKETADGINLRNYELEA
ncbi:MAG: hypothetical protein ABIT47_02315 [Candidatus Paceibacterota bacterium]